MKEKIQHRIEELIEQGESLISAIELDSRGETIYCIKKQSIPAYQEWIFSVSNLIRILVSEDEYYTKEVKDLISH